MPNRKPTYIMADGSRSAQAAQRYFASPPADLLPRVMGTVPQTLGPSYTPYNTFNIRFQLAYRQDAAEFSSVAQAYDALYVIALGAAAGGFTGPQIAAGMKRLSDPMGALFELDTNRLNDTMRALAAGDTINLQGASGPLDFNDRGDPTKGAISLWCLGARAELPELPAPLLDDSGAFTPRDCGPAPMMPPGDMGMMTPDMDMTPDMMMDADMGVADDMEMGD
jgi:branched-chain amino acid transport system substrate-binding protein